ncbi:hypothetical protein GCM10009791_30980 [Citricoccus zhacaiensis]
MCIWRGMPRVAVPVGNGSDQWWCGAVQLAGLDRAVSVLRIQELSRSRCGVRQPWLCDGLRVIFAA